MTSTINPIFPTVQMSSEEMAEIRNNARRPIWNGYIEEIYSSDGTFQRVDTWVSINTDEEGEWVARFIGTDYIIEGDDDALGIDLYEQAFPIGNAHDGVCVIAGATLREVLEKLSSFSDT